MFEGSSPEREIRVCAEAWLRDNLVCPRDHASLSSVGDALHCDHGHSYPVIDGVPIMLVDELAPTHAACSAPPVATAVATAGDVDPHVQRALVDTCGNLYRPVAGRLARYPIPELDTVPPTVGSVFLDIGSNWGRWCIAASRRGFTAVGIDPDLEAALAGRRVAAQLGADVAYVVGDGRALPFATGVVDVAHSFSVLQHFSVDDARSAIAEAARVTRPGGRVHVQMANGRGALPLLSRVRADRQTQHGFRVRRWSVRDLERTFTELVGDTSVSADAFFALNAQQADADLLSRRHAAVVRASGALKALSRRWPALVAVADSVAVDAIKRA